MTHSHIEHGWEMTGSELSLDDALSIADEIETLANADVDTDWVDEMFDRFEAEAGDAEYPFSLEDDRAFVEAEIARLEALADRVGEDLLDNVADEANLAALYDRRDELAGRA